jgi:dTDP-4-dehydrorhamnose 3,5-epimerase-like enzyme
MKPSIITIEKIGNSDLGYISVAELEAHIPFEIKRVYWTYDTPQDVMRGHHAHKTLHQALFAVKGIVRFTFENVEGDVYEFTLDSPEKGIVVPPRFWREIQFSHDAILLCLASAKYDENDYIRDYSIFKSLSKK